jgi:6-phosphogluconolactonase (cycloisomerase 2 family)
MENTSMLSRKFLVLAGLVLLICIVALPAAPAATKVARYAYEANQNQLVAYTVDPTTGRLRVIQALTTANLTGFAITVNPSGKFVYLTTGYLGGAEIYGYKIGSTGLLTPITGSPFSSGGGTLKFVPRQVRLHQRSSFQQCSGVLCKHHHGSVNVDRVRHRRHQSAGFNPHAQGHALVHAELWGQHDFRI